MTNRNQNEKRLPKFKRAKEKERPKLRLQNRDIEILKAVYKHRFLSSQQIKLLIEGSDQVILRRLQKLYHHGFLDRPPRQFYWLPDGNKHIVYALGNNGASILSELLGIDIGKIDWRTKNSEVKFRYIKHIMQISNFRCCLNLALKDQPETEIVSWQQSSADLMDKIMIEGKRYSVYPDAFFTLADKDEEMYFFVEADQSSMTNERFFKKMIGYWHWWKQGRQEKKYDISSFRVLTITKTEKRKENLRAVTKKADDRQVGSVMFWFSSEENYSIDRPKDVLKPIWQTPKNNEYHRLLE